MRGLPTEATRRSSTGVLGVRYDPRRKTAPYQANYNGKSLGWFPSMEQALYMRLHHEMHEVGIRPLREEEYRKAGFPEDVIEKYSCSM